MPSNHKNCRPPAVAGIFYADNPRQLEADIQQHLINATPSSSTIPKALIVPHAGYIYSGPIAASAYTLLLPIATKIKQVILLGPSHHVAFNGIATAGVEFFSSPLGEVKINLEFCQKAESLDFVNVNIAAHKNEHSLEVQLPFLQCVLNDFELTPLLVGDCSPQKIVQLLELFWHRQDSIIIISTDLSHFHRYSDAITIDQNTSHAIEQLMPLKISFEQACGCKPLNGLLELATKYKLTVDLLDLRNSGDTGGDKNRVVGYAAYVVY